MSQAQLDQEDGEMVMVGDQEIVRNKRGNKRKPNLSDTSFISVSLQQSPPTPLKQKTPKSRRSISSTLIQIEPSVMSSLSTQTEPSLLPSTDLGDNQPSDSTITLTLDQARAVAAKVRYELMNIFILT